MALAADTTINGNWSKLHANNCYNYACNIMNDDYSWPGRFCGLPRDKCFLGDEYDSIETAEEMFIELVQEDGLIQVDDENAIVPDGWHLTVAFFDARYGEYEDFHWYRKDLDGTWSHKMGGNEVKKGITNPVTSASRHGYTLLIGWFIAKDQPIATYI